MPEFMHKPPQRMDMVETKLKTAEERVKNHTHLDDDAGWVVDYNRAKMMLMLDRQAHCDELVRRLEGMKVAISPSGVVEYYTAQVATNKTIDQAITIVKEVYNNNIK